MANLYDSHAWRKYRSSVLAEDAECAFAHLAGECQGALGVHHVKPLSEGGDPFPRDKDGVAILCARHHTLLHHWRKKQAPQWRRCTHNHRYAWAREECEARLNGVSHVNV
jgi:hypothetical protein